MKTHDESLLDTIIVGRVQPRIYAFETGTVPRYLKVGDTYRPLATRLNEWRKHFADLRPVADFEASVNESVFFRDYSVHDVLENDYGRQRLHPSDMPAGVYYSCEFFNEATGDDVSNAVEQIKTAYQEESPRFSYYDATTRLPAVHTYIRGPEWKLRPNQEAAVDAFENAVKNLERTNLLMYAVMRFGKSFTSLECSKRIDAKRIYIVSAKADVKDEWKKTVEQAGNFEGYQFVSSQELLNNPDAIEQILANGGVAVVFLTLQDLQGKNLKEKHKSVFSEKADLLIVDESHFGARAEEYGRVLTGASKNAAEDKRALKKETKEEVSVEEATEAVSKHLQAKVTLHLSGTPYRILMGSEFSKEDIIAFVQFSDIVAEQEAWDAENLTKEQDLNQQVEEWENPYFGFPQMIRFAFHPNESSRNRMKQLQDAGYSFAFSGLLEPKSIEKDQKNGLHKAFKYEREILDLLGAIDGSKDDQNVLGLLDNERVKDGKLCHHIVMVLPYCASCDAMEELIREHADTFRNLSEYEIINISGHEVSKQNQTVQGVKQAIAQAAAEGRKTLTLTVNKMLTGTTVEQWDTMIFLKDTSSPQEYDQAIFRLQNQWVTEMVDPETKRVIKFNMKPQTLLVDFSPNRMFRMQEQKSLIFNANTDQNGNARLAERLRRELEISPIITINKDKLQEVEPADILAAISQYNAERSISDETREIPIDAGLFTDEELLAVLRKQSEFGTGSGLTLAPNTGTEQEFETEDDDSRLGGTDSGSNAVTNPTTPGVGESTEDLKRLSRQLQTYYQRILFYALLTEDDINSLEEVFASLGQDRNSRLATNLSLQQTTVKRILDLIDPFKLSKLDYKIQNISRLATDDTLSPLERANRALNKFSRISESEVRTPSWICDFMINQFGDDQLRSLVGQKLPILDLSSKSAEFGIAIYKKLTEGLGFEHEAVKDLIFSIPTSPIAFEFTRKFYEILGLNPQCISEGVTSFDLLKQEISTTEKLAEIFGNDVCQVAKGREKGLKTVRFGAVVGNPPYHESKMGTSAHQIYPFYMDLAYEVADLACLITPAKFLSGAGKGHEAWNKRMLNDGHINVVKYWESSSDVFDEVDIKGGVVVTLRDLEQNYGPLGPFSLYPPLKGILEKVFRNSNKTIREIIHLQLKFDLESLYADYPSYRSVIGSAGNERRLTTNILGKLPALFEERPQGHNSVAVMGLINLKRTTRYVETKYIAEAVQLDKWKVVLSKTIGTGRFGEELTGMVLMGPNSGHTQSFISIGAFDSEQEAKAAATYLKTKFARALLSTRKVTQDNNSAVWESVPLQDFSNSSDIDWNGSVSEISSQLYDKYELTKEEREFIESSVDKMAD